MIKNYRFKNFASYLDEVFVDFSVSKKTAHSYYDHEFSNGEKTAKVAGVFGANGSGKSNLVKPLAFLAWFISGSFSTNKEEKRIPYSPHFSTPDANGEIEVEFCKQIQGDEHEVEVDFKYSVEFNKDMVLKEELKMKTSHLFSSVFSRVYDVKSDEYTIKKNNSYFHLPLKLLSNAPKNCSLISYTHWITEDKFKKSDDTEHEVDVAYIVGEYFNTMYSNLKSAGRRNFSSNLSIATEYLMHNEAPFEKVKQLLLRYDLGISDIVIEESHVVLEEGGEETRAVAYCYHTLGDKSYRLPIHLESSGTISAFSLLYTVVQTLEHGSIAVLDEFDNDLHPHFAQEIVDLYKNESSNPNKAQLIFTSHTTEMLKTLRKQHIHFTEKNECVSETYRADEIEGLKDRDNLYSKYINGALGALPSYN
ncbi:MAG: AAA15 family ATPase/GTPase [Oleispira sp.]|jgi:AAA15 family ATPase/GTPase